MDIKQMQEINLNMLKMLKQFCQENDIEFFLDAGSLLGAVRHQGFIPWDDDIDIAMTRENFKKFDTLCKENKLPKPYDYATPLWLGGKEYFYDFVPRVFDTSIVIREEKKYEEKYRGFFRYPHIDVFILDEVDKDKIKKAQFMQKMIFGFAMGHRYNIDYKKYSLIQKIEVFILTLIGRCKKLKNIANWQEQISLKYNTAKCKDKLLYYSNYEPMWQYVQLEKDWYSKKIEARFEDTTFPIPHGYDKVLRTIYGDYKQLPKKEEQKSSHKEMF